MRGASVRTCLAFQLADEGLQGGQLVAEGRSAGLGEADPGARTAALVALLDVDQAGPLEDAQMLGEVAAGEVEGLAEEAELDSFRLVRHREDPEPHPLVDHVVQAVDRVLGHGAPAVAGRSRTAKRALPASRTSPGTRTPG